MVRTPPLGSWILIERVDTTDDGELLPGPNPVRAWAASVVGSRSAPNDARGGRRMLLLVQYLSGEAGEVYYPSPDVVGKLAASAGAAHLRLGASTCQVLQVGVLALPRSLNLDDGEGERLEACTALVVARAAAGNYSSEERVLCSSTKSQAPTARWCTWWSATS